VRKPKVAKSDERPASGRGSSAEERVERVFKVLVGAPGALSRGEVATKAKITPDAARYALVSLRSEGRAFSAGAARSARWAITQEAADEASGATG
jgi:hypothetical protein